ncbi:MAG: hypothetical protein ABIF77_06385 [bacterium]
MVTDCHHHQLLAAKRPCQIFTGHDIQDNSSHWRQPQQPFTLTSADAAGDDHQRALVTPHEIHHRRSANGQFSCAVRQSQ